MPRTTAHIGIAACSAEGAALCYRTICAEARTLMGEHDHPEITLHAPPFAAYMEPIERDDWEGVATLMLASAEKLRDAGANFLICPDNTIHQALPFVIPRSPLPWLHIADVVGEAASQRGLQKIGITGTRWLVTSDVYPRAFGARGIEWLRPLPDVREEINRIIMDELVYGIFKPESIAYFQSAIDGFKRLGCDGVVLGCTEIPLIIGDHNSALPTLDSTRLLARAALARAIRDKEQSPLP